MKTSPANPGKHRILIVDDQPDVANSFQVLLTAIGQDAEVAFNGKDALNTARRFCPEIAFLDLSMPDMSGYELARQLRGEFGKEELTLIAVSGRIPQAIEQKNQAFDRYLLKPVEFQVMIDLLNS